MDRAKLYRARADWQRALASATRSAQLYPLPQTLGYVGDAQRALSDAAGSARTDALIRAGRIGAVREVVWRTLRTQPAAAAGGDSWRVDPAIAGGGVSAPFYGRQQGEPLPNVDLSSLRGYGADVPVLIGWASSAGIYQGWFGVRGGFEYDSIENLTSEPKAVTLGIPPIGLSATPPSYRLAPPPLGEPFG